MIQVSGKKVLVLGLNAVSFETMKVLQDLGATVQAYGKIANLGWKKKIAQEQGAFAGQVFTGEEPPPAIYNAQIVVVSGRKAGFREVLGKFAAKHVQAWTMLELAQKFAKIPVIGITGTNGKSTVAKMIERMLVQSGRKVFLGGGSFEPFSKLIRDSKAWELAIFEMSSTALEEESVFKPKIAVLTNLVPAHHDRHKNISDYFDAKAKVFSSQSKEDSLVFDASNAYLRDVVKKAKSRLFPIYPSLPKSMAPSELSQGTYRIKNNIYFCQPQEKPEVYSTENMKLKGGYHFANALCALTAARLAGADPESIQQALDQFDGLPHRMKKCLVKDGITFYDDSRSSNPASTAWGLVQFDKPVILITGGHHRGDDYGLLADYIKAKVKLLILIEESRRRMFSRLKGITETYLVETLEEAIHLMRAKGQEGDILVFSPATPPEPLIYEGFEDRGKKFLELLKETFGIELEKKRRNESFRSGGIKI